MSLRISFQSRKLRALASNDERPVLPSHQLPGLKELIEAFFHGDAAKEQGVAIGGQGSGRYLLIEEMVNDIDAIFWNSHFHANRLLSVADGDPASDFFENAFPSGKGDHGS